MDHSFRDDFDDGNNNEFEPYDRFAQDRLNSTQSTNELLEEFKKVRFDNIAKVRSWKLSESDLNKIGMHPGFGKVTSRQLLSTWTVHDLVHLNQVSRVMIKHYAKDIGPWKNYINLLKD